MKLTKLLLATAIAASATTAVPAAAVETVFAQIGLTASNANFRWVRGTGGNGTFYTTSSGSAFSAGNALVTFSLVGAPTPLFVLANLFLSGTTTGDPAMVTAGAFVQAIDSYTFNITATSNINYNNVIVNAGQSLLSGTVDSSSISGNIGGSTGNFSGSTLGGATITYASPLFTFAPLTNYGFSFGLGSVNPTFSALANRSLTGFRSTLSGTFQSDPAPTFVAVPEPATWAMMIVGMGLVGFARRRRSTVVAA
jgi:hypothetical protein